MAILDIFNGDAFRTTTLIAALENSEYVPSRLGQIGLFTSTPIRTESISIEMRQNNTLKLIPTSQRGAPVVQTTQGKRRMRSFGTTRIGAGDRVMASELAFVRQFGEEQAVQQVQAEVARRWTGPTGLINTVDLTLEHMRLGAIKGQMIDADGSVIEDWVTAFDAPGSTPSVIPTITFDFTTLANGELREKLVKLKRDIARNSDGVWTAQTKIHVLCGDNFFDKLAQNAEVREHYKNRVNAALVVEGYDAFDTIEFHGWIFENYRGTDDESTVAIGVDEAHAFPVNTAGAFLHAKAPGESFEDLGMLGKDLYPLITPDLTGHNRYVDLEVLAYPLFVTTRPKMLRRFELV